LAVTDDTKDKTLPQEARIPVELFIKLMMMGDQANKVKGYISQLPQDRQKRLKKAMN